MVVDTLPSYSLDEVAKHRFGDDKWLVVDGYVYDISQWQYEHPGGRCVVSYLAGQDASVNIIPT